MDIMTVEKMSSIEVANMDITYWSFVHPERGEGIRENWVDWWDHFNRVHKNMVQHPSNNISIYHSNASYKFHFKYMVYDPGNNKSIVRLYVKESML